MNKKIIADAVAEFKKLLLREHNYGEGLGVMTWMAQGRYRLIMCGEYYGFVTFYGYKKYTEYMIEISRCDCTLHIKFENNERKTNLHNQN